MKPEIEQGNLAKLIIKATERLDVSNLLDLLKQGADVNTMDDNETLLTIATKTGKFDSIPLMLEAYIHNVKDEKKVQKILDMKIILEAAGCDFSDGRAGHGTLDHYISNLADYSSEERIEFMKALIEKGADINLHGKDGLNSLQYAVWKADTKMVDFLLRNGADCNINYYPEDKGSFENILENAYLELTIAESGYKEMPTSILFDGMDDELFKEKVDNLRIIVEMLEYKKFKSDNLEITE